MRYDRIGLIDQLEMQQILLKEELVYLIANFGEKESRYLFERAAAMRKKNYGTDVYIRGLIEITSYCKRNCLYCGIRAGNQHAERYRLTKEEILECCHIGNELGFKTFVLQGGEDPYYTDELMTDIILAIKKAYPENAITLSLGEKSYESYKMFREAGADRYLLRHETANNEHYNQLHPPQMSGQERKHCLADLKRLGFQFGTGFMVGSPFQTPELLAEDLLFIHEIQPQMVGIGPFIPHHETPFADQQAGSVPLTLFMIGLLRLILPHALLPSTTALGTAEANGRELGILAGANVIMPNLSPLDVRKKYMIYDNKIATGLEAAESLAGLKKSMNAIGYQIVETRGDFKK
ncbi:MAG: [FeFe] hydrogenase H-cluster radical SAM maturase HydE [Bacteroidales bacterium]|jgi:biotin synthase|nr:[FeFe] hydrogenase H-cluster radical SAM maturase HydE [Bacteroidales bacterium]